LKSALAVDLHAKAGCDVYGFRPPIQRIRRLLVGGRRNHGRGFCIRQATTG